MNRLNSRIFCAVLALLLALGALAALAETETKTYKTYTPVDVLTHEVIEETWIYPVINGSAGSGKPAGDSHLGSGKPGGDNVYTELHTFENGACIYCGFAAETFTNAMGVVLPKGAPAADALKLVFAAVPAASNLSVVGGAAGNGDTLVGLVSNSAAPEALNPALDAFPAESVDGVDSHVVTLSYADANGAPVTENYAFSAADATLVKLY